MSMQLSLSQIAELLNLPSPAVDEVVTGAVIDSRQIQMGNLFVALVGEHVDGHKYLAKAREAGASVALVSEKQADTLPQLVVNDVVAAFGKIAHFWRMQCSAKLVAITGSNGKTTVKEMTASILRQCGKVVATQGNLNNELGVPLTLCRLDLDTDYAVIEMGASHTGEIARLTAMARPEVALINNVSAAHLEGFGSVRAIAEAKGEIFSGLTSEGVGIINTDMDFVAYWDALLVNYKRVSFSVSKPADYMANDLQLGVTGSHFMVKVADSFHYIDLPLLGEHNVSNALAAISITTALNIPVSAIEKGLAEVKPAPHRLQARESVKGARLLDDSYNANPGSFTQALAVLQSLVGTHWVVLGDFGELGEETISLHTQLGDAAKAAGVSRLFTIGKDSEHASTAFGIGARHFKDREKLQQHLESELHAEVTLLIKGSRFMALDTLANTLALNS